MELRHLRHFVAVAEAGNLSRAAARVFISQPALTRSIQALEEAVGAALIVRSPRGVAPTEAGLRLLEHARFILSACERAQADVVAVEGRSRPQLNLGFAAMFADHVVDRAVAEICAAEPKARVLARFGYFEDLVEELLAGALDLMFCNIPASARSKELVIEPLIEIRAQVVAHADHPLVRRGRASRAELAEARWLVIDQPHAREGLEALFLEDGLPAPEPIVATNSLNMMRSLLAQDNFVAVLPDHLVSRQLAEGSLAVIATPGFSVRRTAGLIYRRETARTPLALAMMAALRRLSQRAPFDARRA
jgi:DNA-binding transcriptional LysR family regulator